MTKWVTKKLGEIGHLLSGLTYSPNNVVDEGVLVLRSSNIQDDNISLEDNVYVNVTEYNSVQIGDILICVRNGSRALIGKTARINKDVEGSAFGAFMIVYRSEYNDFLYHFFKTNSFFSQVSRNIGATINSINGSDLREMVVPFPIQDDGTPDLAEQRRIAAILSSADKVIATIEALIEKYKHIKQGMLTDLMQPKEGWKKVKLGEVIIDSYAGGTPNRSKDDYFNGDIPWVSSGEVNNPEITSTIENISNAGLNNSSAKWIPANSILVALYGATAGQVSMLRIKATSNQAVLAVLPNNEIIDTTFLFYQIGFNKQALLFLAQGSGQPNLSKNIVDRLEIPYPTDLTEQRRIASILSSIDAKILAEEKVVEKYKGVKKGLMERMMKGE